MLTRINKHRDEAGFTLIELLVVVIIIGILAAIAIPVFLNQRASAQNASIQSDLRNAAIEVETYYTTKQAYPTADEPTGGTGRMHHCLHGQQVVTYTPDMRDRAEQLYADWLQHRTRATCTCTTPLPVGLHLRGRNQRHCCCVLNR